MHPLESLGDHLVSHPFDGDGFVIWHKNMLTILSVKNKLGLITGRVSKLQFNSPYYHFWGRCNDMIIAWITNSLSRDIANSVMCFDTAKDVWTDINERFGTSNGSKYIQLQREISLTSQVHLDIATYFTKLGGLWDELSTAYVGLVCSCGALPKFIEEQKIYQFLSGLNESYCTCKSNILRMPSIPSLSKAYSMLQHDEKQKETYIPVPGFSHDFASFNALAGSLNTSKGFNQRVQFDTNRGSSSSSNLPCRYCKKLGHTIDKCYKLHGFPSDFKFTKNRRFATCVQSDGHLLELAFTKPNSFDTVDMDSVKNNTNIS
ncbi:uncharacterized protein LOC107761742 isoform X1 [Nicotiana tabacum]|uniref:Uncharacterized protein LOC107761742 isoform X1 n=10 Tax=Nicotiana tabacum TaxID=4097 RepID=A0AC58SDK7_TOBAC